MGLKNNTQSIHDSHQSGFSFGLMLGSLVGTAGLYLLGTSAGRKKMRDMLDSFDALDTDLIADIKKLADDKGDATAKKVVSDIHIVLDKIESSLPSRKEVSKYFAKDGHLMK